MPCEGYKTRLTWGSPDAGSSTGSGIVLKPVRQPRAKSRIMRKRETEITAETLPDISMELGDFQSPDDLDLLCLQFELTSEPLPDEDVAEKLMESCKIIVLRVDLPNSRIVRTSGYQTLTDRAGQSQNTVFTSCILPLSDGCIALKQACIAYQASLSSTTSHYTPLYMESALSNYLSDLDNPDRLSQDVTLATGVLLCSVSVSNTLIEQHRVANIIRLIRFTSGLLY